MRSRVTVLAAIWLLQAVTPVLLLPLVFMESWAFESYTDFLSDVGLWKGVGIAAGAVTVAQALFLWRVRTPRARAEGRSIWLSIAVAAFACALLTFAGVLALVSAATLAGLKAQNSDAASWAALAIGAASWAAWTPIIAAFCRRRDAETALSRLAARLLLGTAVEIVAIVPVNVMVRRKHDCYSWDPTVGSLILCLGVGWFAFGPAVFLPLLVRRRRRWYAGHCDACGYDMSGCLTASRCPECGSGWAGHAPMA